ncbi:rRNA maturation RNase YbeY [Candidatus Solincola tengchongensis]|uniref:rRNA maturation RNase YbeY n=1 Tax=Candidatus Solincola tengchongensis TaxID=2900693 RepID=UPI00257A7719|nr:rRNA maturation RNase YbeY [Candidatus Solincola tengchongensis]
MRVLVNRRCRSVLDEGALRRACLKALRSEGAAENSVLSLTALSEREMADYNRKYLNRDGPTDVLAFPLGEDDGETRLLGDVLVCPSFVRRHRRRYAVEEGRELELVAVHGVLHLLGYEDESEKGAGIMDRRAREILGLRGEEGR